MEGGLAPKGAVPPLSGAPEGGWFRFACVNLWERARGGGHEAIVHAARREGVVGEDGGGLGSDGAAPFQELDIPRYFHPHHHLLALREGGVAGVEGGLAPKERCLPPPGRQKEGLSLIHISEPTRPY